MYSTIKSMVHETFLYFKSNDFSRNDVNDIFPELESIADNCEFWILANGNGNV